jgi:hypothetical protein
MHTSGAFASHSTTRRIIFSPSKQTENCSLEKKSIRSGEEAERTKKSRTRKIKKSWKPPLWKEESRVGRSAYKAGIISLGRETPARTGGRASLRSRQSTDSLENQVHSLILFLERSQGQQEQGRVEELLISVVYGRPRGPSLLLPIASIKNHTISTYQSNRAC